MAPRFAGLVLIGVGLFLFFLTYEAWVEVNDAKRRRRGVFQRVESVSNEINKLKAAPPKALQPREKAVQELLGRMVDDTELLGSSVRFELQDQLKWQSIKYGVEKAQIHMSSAALTDSAMGYFAILWALIQERPVNIIKGKITLSNETVTFYLTLELFGLGEQATLSLDAPR